MINRQPLKLRFLLPRLIANPLEGSCGDQAQDQEVVATKTGGVLPGLSVLVGALKGDVEQGTFVGLLAPNARTYGAVANFVDGPIVRGTGLCLIFHDVFGLFV
jgi:hypothetical protein